jgi:uncharacterized repeat protein (TIGR04138 family)
LTSPGWKSAYEAMHRDGVADFPPACLHYVLELIRAESNRHGGPLTPAESSAAFRRAVHADFGPLCDEVLVEWNLRTPGDLGNAVALLGTYGCLSLDAGDSPQAFATDTVPYKEVHP